MISRRKFLRLPIAALSALLPAAALAQGFNPPTADPVTLDLLAADQEELRTGLYLAAFRGNNHENRIKRLEHCWQNCGIVPEVRGDV